MELIYIPLEVYDKEEATALIGPKVTSTILERIPDIRGILIFAFQIPDADPVREVDDPFLGEHILKIWTRVYWTLVQYGERVRSAGQCRQGFANAVREILRVSSCLRDPVDARTLAQFCKRQVRIQEARAIEIVIAPAVQDMANVEPANPAGEVCIADNIDGAAVAEQMVKLGVIRKLIDPLEVDQEKPAHEIR